MDEWERRKAFHRRARQMFRELDREENDMDDQNYAPAPAAEPKDDSENALETLLRDMLAMRDNAADMSDAEQAETVIGLLKTVSDLKRRDDRIKQRNNLAIGLVVAFVGADPGHLRLASEDETAEVARHAIALADALMDRLDRAG